MIMTNLEMSIKESYYHGDKSISASVRVEKFNIKYIYPCHKKKS